MDGIVSVPQPYPGWYYHPPTMSSCLVTSAEDAVAKGIDANWTTNPADYGVETHPEAPANPERDALVQVAAERSLDPWEWRGKTIATVIWDVDNDPPCEIRFTDGTRACLDACDDMLLLVASWEAQQAQRALCQLDWEADAPRRTQTAHAEAAGGEALQQLRQRAKPDLLQGDMPQARFASREE